MKNLIKLKIFDKKKLYKGTKPYRRPKCKINQILIYFSTKTFSENL